MLSRSALLGRRIVGHQRTFLRSHSLKPLSNEKYQLVVTVNNSDNLFFVNRLENVGNVAETIEKELGDAGRVRFFHANNVKMASATPVSELLKHNFVVDVDGVREEVVPEQLVNADAGSGVSAYRLSRSYLYKCIRKRLAAKATDSEHDEPKLSLQQYLAICRDEGVNDNEAQMLLRDLTTLGYVGYFPAYSEWIYLNTGYIYSRPQEFFNVGKKQDNQQALARELESVKAELKPLEQRRQDMEQRALAYAQRMIYGGILALTGQMALLARLTWWDLNWDIMEPFTYFITFSTGVFAYSFYLVRKEDYTFFQLRDIFFNKYMNKAIKRENFDVSTYEDLVAKIKTLEKDIEPPKNFPIS